MNGFVRHIMLSGAAIGAVLLTFVELQAQDSPHISGPQPPLGRVFDPEAQTQRELGPERQAEAGRAPERLRILVLHDGGVLAGDVRQEGDRYLLKRGSLEMQVRASNVLLVANSLEDAYEQRRRSVGQGNTVAHLQLAEWCLRYTMIDQAAVELTAAEKIEPHHGMLALLNRRLALARERAQNPPQMKAPAKPTRPAEIALVQHETGVGELPEGAVELFTRRVQPVLVNNCTKGGCHAAGGEQKFQLDRALLHGLANRRSTMRNLAATLELVDRDQPQLSPLLTVPRQTHGGMERPVFGPRQEAALRHLVEWVVMVTKWTPPAKAAPAEGLQSATEEEVAPDSMASPDSRVPHILNNSQDEQEPPFNTELAEFESIEPHQQRIQFGTQVKRWTPRDEFDPEIFNRKYAPPADEVALPDAESYDAATDDD